MPKLGKVTADGASRVVRLGGAAPVRAVTVFGDSFVGGRTWPTALGTALSMTTVNAGRGGWASSDVALLQGGLTVACTVTSDQIPASGTVAVTVSPTTSFRSDSTGITYTWTGRLAGVPGTLTHTVAGSDGGWTFTRTYGGSVVACPAGTKFRCTQYADQRPTVQVFWCGRNNINPGNVTLADVPRDISAMYYGISTRDKRALVLSVCNGTGEPSGSANYNAITALNSQLAATYGTRYYDARRYLIDNGLAALGLTPTTQDTADIAADKIPTQLMADSLHPTDAAFGLIAQRVAEKITALGWAA